MPDAKPSPEGVLDAYAEAVRAKDVDAFARLYASEVCVFDTWGAWSHRGLEAWRAMVVEWFSSLGPNTVRVSWDEVATAVGGDLAMARAVVTYAAHSPAGVREHAISNRLTWMLRRRGESWEILHEHTSVPVDFESGKAIFKRP